MERLPRRIGEALAAVAADDRDAARVGRGVAGLIEAHLACSDLSRGIEAFREAARGTGLLDEGRSGQRISDAWSKIARYFLDPLEALKARLCGVDGDLVEVSEDLAPLGLRWDRTMSELQAFLDEEKSMDRVLLQTPVGAHAGYRIRSRLALLDRRAERVRVALDLVGRDLLEAARRGAAGLPALLRETTEDEAGGSP